MCEDWVPATNLLWGDSDTLVANPIVSNLEQQDFVVEDHVDGPIQENQYTNDIQEGVTLGDITTSTSRRHKHAWCKHPSWDSDIDSNEYEWESLSDSFTIDMDIDVVHTYSAQPEVANESSVGLLDSNLQVALVDDASLGG